MRKFFKDNLLPICVGLAVVLGVFVPGPGIWLGRTSLSQVLLVVIFLCQGLTFKPSAEASLWGYVPLFLWGVAVNQALAPWLGVWGAGFLPVSESYRVGLILMCCMAPTLVSGAVLAIRAGGDAAAAMLLAVGINVLAVFTVPLNLSLTLGADFELDAWSLLFKLFFLVLVPAVAGNLFGRWRPGLTASWHGPAKQIPIFALATIVYMAISKQSQQLDNLSLLDLVSLSAASLVIHFLLLIVALVVSVRILRLPTPASRSLALVCSEKTLPLAVAVWTLALAEAYPLAILAPIVFHPCQILADGLLANHWSRR